jgi:hypothetical protein
VHFSIFEGERLSEKLCGDCEEDRAEFAKAHGSQLPTPGGFRMLLEDCVADSDEDDGERWGPMLRAIEARAKGGENG